MRLLGTVKMVIFNTGYVKEKPTHIGNLYLWQAKDPLCTRAAVEFGLGVKRSDDIKAISLELDETYQGFLDHYHEINKKLEDDMMPGFSYAINAGIRLRIPVYASDKHEKEFGTRVYELSTELREKIVSATDKEFRAIMKKWDDSLELLEDVRAENTAQNLEKIAQKTDGKVIHLCSEKMALKIIKLI